MGPGDKSETILAKSYELLKYSLPVLSRYPKNYKYTLGDRTQGLLGELHECLIEAFYSPPEAKRPLLARANIVLEKLRQYQRLAFELGVYDSGRFREFAQRTDEIGRMVGGWQKSLR